MTTFPRFHSTASTPAFRSLSPYNRQARKVFCELADRLLVTAHSTAEACFAPWNRTTLAERAVIAAQTAADLRARPVTIWTVAELPLNHLELCGYERIRFRLSLHAPAK